MCTFKNMEYSSTQNCFDVSYIKLLLFFLMITYFKGKLNRDVFIITLQPSYVV